MEAKRRLDPDVLGRPRLWTGERWPKHVSLHGKLSG